MEVVATVASALDVLCAAWISIDLLVLEISQPIVRKELASPAREVVGIALVAQLIRGEGRWQASWRPQFESYGVLSIWVEITESKDKDYLMKE